MKDKFTEARWVEGKVQEGQANRGKTSDVPSARPAFFDLVLPTSGPKDLAL